MQDFARKQCKDSLNHPTPHLHPPHPFMTHSKLVAVSAKPFLSAMNGTFLVFAFGQ